MSSWFTPGSTVVFRSYAIDNKTQKVMQAKDVKYFYITIPNQPNVKLHFDAKAPGASQGMPWTGQWVVPANYSPGPVYFRVLIKIKAQRKGQVVQMPVATSQLNISATAPATSGPTPIHRKPMIAPKRSVVAGVAGSMKYQASASERRM